MSQHEATGHLPERVSYLFMVGMLLLMGWLHLGTLLLTSLLAYLALSHLRLKNRVSKLLAIGIFLILILAIFYGLGTFVRQTAHVLPVIANKAIPSVIEWAKEYQIELPFTDYDSLKETAIEMVQNQAQFLSGFARFARGASTQILFLIAGCVVAISVFLHPQLELGRHPETSANNLYSLCCAEISRRFQALYASFVTVMGAQIVISAINTTLTAIFVFAVGLPYAVVVIGVTFLCGLLPVVGNLISNTIIVGIGFTVSPKMALGALVFLVTIHKLEYILNSKIIGLRIRNPVWLTLLALIIGEKLMGIPGMILAPVLLNYLKVEVSKKELKPALESGEIAISKESRAG